MIFYDLFIGITSNLMWNKIQKSIEPKETISIRENTYSVSQEKTFKPSEKPNYNSEIAQRLSLSLEHFDTNERKITISLVCDFLNYKSVSEIEKYFLGKKEPSLKFLKDYSNFFGIELSWLRHGEGSIFLRRNLFGIFYEGYLESIIDLKPEKIYFVRNKGKNGDAGIVLMISNYKYIILSKTCNISSHVGETGKLKIEAFFDLIKSLSLEFSSNDLHGLEVDEEIFFDLFYGKIYPGKIIKSIQRAIYWWEDFLDYEHKMPISASYIRLYGIEFIKAQQIIKERKEKNR